jgi:hypothetical protein
LLAILLALIFVRELLGCADFSGETLGFEKISGSQRTRDRVLNLPLSDRSKMTKKLDQQAPVLQR